MTATIPKPGSNDPEFAERQALIELVKTNPYIRIEEIEPPEE
jgi:hypothetical protein